MSEWRLFPEGTVPDFTTPEFFAAHGWVPPLHQIGHAERMAMTAGVINDLLGNTVGEITKVYDLGCGDGSLLDLISPRNNVEFYGVDACVASVDIAHEKGYGDFVSIGDIRSTCTLGIDLVVASEVIEHMLDPHGFVAELESDYAVFTSPAHEDADWHYGHHAWAWDMEGYADMIQQADWGILRHEVCDAPAVDHGYGLRPQKYQVIVATRKDGYV